MYLYFFAIFAGWLSKALQISRPIAKMASPLVMANVFNCFWFFVDVMAYCPSDLNNLFYLNILL